jgi:cellulose synthase (UDP-forming)
MWARFQEVINRLIRSYPQYILVFFALLFFLLISSHFNPASQALIAYGTVEFFIVAIVAGFADKIRLTLLFLALLVSWRYIVWRITDTIVYTGFFDFIGTLLLVIAEIYGLILSTLGIFTSLNLLDRKPLSIAQIAPSNLPTVDVVIPTYNEDFELVIDTALAAAMMHYPKEKLRVCILDDGGSDQKISDPDPAKRAIALKRREQFHHFCTENGVSYITRERNINAKAGNINSALRYLEGELILILDCDHIPTHDFLENTVGEFIHDPKMFLVQTPHAFYNPDPVEKNLNVFRHSPSENEMFYYHIQKGHDFWESSFFCGSAAVLRRKYLDEVGGIAGETITEDAETALKLHAKGYKSAYIAIPMIRGLQPESFSALVLQRVRWSQGMIQIFLLVNPLMQNLKLHQKLSYFSASFFWFFSYARVVYLLAPLGYLLFGLRVYHATPMEIVIYTIPNLILAITVSYYLYRKVRWSFYSEVYETALSLFTLPAIFSVFLHPRAPEFAVTPKGENSEEDFISQLYTPFMIILLLIVVGFFMGIYRFIADPALWTVTLTTLVWNSFNLFLILSALVIVYEKRQVRRYTRIPSDELVMLTLNNQTYYGKVSDISMGGISVNFYEDEEGNLPPALDRYTIYTLIVEDEMGIKTALKGKYLHHFKYTSVFRFTESSYDMRQRKALLRIMFGKNTRWIEYEKIEEHLTPIAAFFQLSSKIRHELKLAKIFAHFFAELKLSWETFRHTKIKG